MPKSGSSISSQPPGASQETIFRRIRIRSGTCISTATETDPSWLRTWTLLGGFRRLIHVVGAGHEDFADTAGFIDALGLSGQYPPDALGSIPPARATAATRQVLTAFFGHFLRGRPGGTALLDNPQLFNPNLQRLG